MVDGYEAEEGNGVCGLGLLMRLRIRRANGME